MYNRTSKRSQTTSYIVEAVTIYMSMDVLNNLLKILTVSHVILWQEIMNHLTAAMNSSSWSCEIMHHASPLFCMIKKLEGV